MSCKIHGGLISSCTSQAATGPSLVAVPNLVACVSGYVQDCVIRWIRAATLLKEGHYAAVMLVGLVAGSVS